MVDGGSFLSCAMYTCFRGFSLQIGLSMAFVLMFGNEMLFSSWLFSCLAASAMAFYVVEPLMKTSTSASGRLIEAIVFCLLLENK